MLYSLYGTDIDSARKKANVLVETLRAKKPDASFVVMDEENWNKGNFEELIGGQGLFERKAIVFLKRLLGKKEIAEVILEKMADIKTSENIFIIFDGKLNKEAVNTLKKFSEKIQEFDKDEVRREKEGFKIFDLAEAFGRRDKKSLWVLYEKALRRGAVPEEVCGILFWKAKDLFMSSGRPGGKFSREEILAIASRLVNLYHDSHRGLIDFEVGLERFVLSL